MKTSARLAAIVYFLLLTTVAWSADTNTNAEKLDGMTVVQTASVILELLVTVDGHVKDVRVFKSSGLPKFDQDALEETRRKVRKINPIKKDGKPIEAWGQLKVTMKIVE